MIGGVGALFAPCLRRFESGSADLKSFCFAFHAVILPVGSGTRGVRYWYKLAGP